MKVIDAMIKISRGEKVRFEILNDENHIYSSTNGSYLYDETSEEDVYWFIDEDWLNREIKLIEEDKKIEKYDTGLTNGRYTEDSIKTGLDTDTTIENIIINMGIEITLVKEKMFEIIDYIMEDKHD